MPLEIGRAELALSNSHATATNPYANFIKFSCFIFTPFTPPILKMIMTETHHQQHILPRSCMSCSSSRQFHARDGFDEAHPCCSKPSIFRGGSLSFAVSLREGNQSSQPLSTVTSYFLFKPLIEKKICETKSSFPKFGLITKKKLLKPPTTNHHLAATQNPLPQKKMKRCPQVSI